jgi:alkanesulfonate monooxygenase SsuD/methylene tetrahydromethanopterin reductase-like flavin-dependent oxidoreductase (luciferase family)
VSAARTTGTTGTPRIPLAVLDLVPVSSGTSFAVAVRNAVDLARRAEQFGYQRYWFAEHHLNPGVIGASPAVSIALVAAATSSWPVRPVR